MDAFDQLEQKQPPPTTPTTPPATSTSATTPTTGDAFDQLEAQPAPQAAPDPMDADKSIGPEERQFLKNNPTYKYLPKDPRFPNREPGIYPMGPGNEWRNDPNHPNHDISQAPVDLHLLKHTLEGAAAGAAAVAPAVGLAAIPEALPSVLIHTVEGVKALGTWAEANPYKAFMLFQVAKELLPGAKKAMGFIKAAPTGE
jgi:hypothetical protein